MKMAACPAVEREGNRDSPPPGHGHPALPSIAPFVCPPSSPRRLTDYVTKIFSSVVGAGAAAGAAAAAASAISVTMPLAEGGASSEGFACIEFASREDAEKALAATNGYDFDARHKLRVYPYELAREYVGEPEEGEWEPPRPAELKEATDLYHWLYDESGRDQFSLGWLDASDRGHHEVFFSDAKRAPQLEFAGDADAMSYAGKAWAFAHSMKWSPKGTFLATLSARGVRLWSGSKHLYGHGFEHMGVSEVVFSPSEANVITWNGHEGNVRCLFFGGRGQGRGSGSGRSAPSDAPRASVCLYL